MTKDTVITKKLVVPSNIIRGAKHNSITAEQSGSELMELVCLLLDWKDFSDKDILDIGCGTRIVQAIIGNEIKVGTYVGLDVFKELIEFLKNEVTDENLNFHHMNVYNKMYNRESTQILSMDYNLPIGNQKFDVVWLFSVFTHLEPQDADCLLHIIKKHLKPMGKLIFSVFIDNDISGFHDMDADNPLLFATYSESLIHHLIKRNGLNIISSNPKKKSSLGEFVLIQHHFVCELSQ